MTYSPIALFTYCRADKTQRAVESILCNTEAKDTDLFVFSDGLKVYPGEKKTEEKRNGVEENRRYIHTIKGFKSVTIIERETNLGLSRSLISGITDIVNKYGRVIVVEDDLVLSPYFLKFMNDALEKYKDDDRVSTVSAFLNPVSGDVPETFFLRYFACWGWATWKRAWDLFNSDANDLLKQLRWKTNDFNIGGSSNFYGMLYCQKVGLIDSWAIRFYASLFLKGKLQLFPGRTMAIQHGMDGSGTHSGIDKTFANMQLSQTPIEVADIPVEESKSMYKSFSDFYGRQVNKKSVLYQYGKLKSFIRRLIGIDYR